MLQILQAFKRLQLSDSVCVQIQLGDVMQIIQKPQLADVVEVQIQHRASAYYRYPAHFKKSMIRISGILLHLRQTLDNDIWAFNNVVVVYFWVFDKLKVTDFFMSFITNYQFLRLSYTCSRFLVCSLMRQTIS
ncbi:Hypothetical_protein [Hexamita inflata]|uniref:Hypothetical_protein n=1 Tax=Hexamita inflata TaxID=28002 RepID=A0AA86RDS8_9EUKA|nr:Hypothetical protein HINF_LOCUS62172 [Hexamita inflata]